MSGDRFETEDRRPMTEDGQNLALTLISLGCDSYWCYCGYTYYIIIISYICSMQLDNNGRK